MSRPAISKVKFLKGPFKQRRLTWSSRSLFIAILVPRKAIVDPEPIGEQLFPDGFGCIEPPGPIDGFGSLGLPRDEDYCFDVLSLRKRAQLETLAKFMDGFFIVDPTQRCILEVSMKEFSKAISGAEFEKVRVAEFEPD